MRLTRFGVADFDSEASATNHALGMSVGRPVGIPATFGVSVNKKFDGDPNFAAVVDGKLYVFLSEEIYQAFRKDQAGTIAKAAANWKAIEHTAARDL